MNPDDIKKLYAITTIPSLDDEAWHRIYDGSSTPTGNEYAIKGQMLMVSHHYDDYFMINEMGRDEVKRQLAMQLAMELLKSKLIEFTQEKDAISGKTLVRARAFVTPSNQVQILREKGK